MIHEDIFSKVASRVEGLLSYSEEKAKLIQLMRPGLSLQKAA